MRLRTIRRAGLQELGKGRSGVRKLSCRLRSEVVSAQEMPDLSKTAVLRGGWVKVNHCNHQGLLRRDSRAVQDGERRRTNGDY